MKRTTTLFDFAFQSTKKKKEDDNNDQDCSTPQDEVAASSTFVSVSQRSEDSRDSADRGEEGGASISTQSRLVTSSSLSEASTSTETESRTQAQPTSADSSRSKKRVKAQEIWLKKWSWLKLTSDGGMQCELCLKHSKKNTLTAKSGCTNFRTSTLERHVETTDHQQALQAEGLQRDFAVASQAAAKNLTGVDASIQAAMRTVHWLAMEDVAIKKYTSLMEFQKLQGCESVLDLSVGGNATYMSRTAGQEFQECVAEAIHKEVVQKIREADMYSILIDESTDLSVSKHMVVFVRLVDSDFVPHTYFLKNISVNDPQSTASVLFKFLKEALAEEKIDMKKVYGFGSDGASVMVGKSHSVSALMKNENPHCVNVHCMAHRLNLATSQASKHIPYMKEVEKILSDLYFHFGGSKSGNRKCELEQIQKILEDPLLKIKECYQIRWLAFFEAVRTVYLCWASLHEYFKKHEDSSKTKALLSAFKQYKFVAVLAVLMDILPSLSHMCLILQKEDLDIACIQPALQNLQDKIKHVKKGNAHYQTELKEKLELKKNEDGVAVEVKYKGKKLDFGTSLRATSKEIEEIRTTFCDRLTQNIKDRFPKETSDMVAAFGVLAMRPLTFMSAENQKDYGNEEIRVLASFYGQEKKAGDKTSKPLIDMEACIEEWSVAKQTVLQNMYPRDSTKLLYKLLHQYHKESFPNLLVLAKIALLLPLHTSDCERGFSAQNAIKTARRSRLEEGTLNTLMTMKCEGEPIGKQDYSQAIQVWKGKKDRRIVKKH